MQRTSVRYNSPPTRRVLTLKLFFYHDIAIKHYPSFFVAGVFGVLQHAVGKYVAAIVGGGGGVCVLDRLPVLGR